jgi:tRNA(fMet)-specific endonuclease VapC
MYLLDTNLVIELFKGRHRLNERLNQIGRATCRVSEITVIELWVGAELSQRREHHSQLIDSFLETVQVVPISAALHFFALEKARLQKLGRPISDFDLLIGSTAVVNGWTMVTNNTAHFTRISGIQLEDWTQPAS